MADERVMAAFSGRLAVNVDTMCAFGDRVSPTAASEIEFGLLGFVREDAVRNPASDRYELVAIRDAEIRAGIDEIQDVYERLGGDVSSPPSPAPEDLLWSFSTRRRSRPAAVIPPD